jgi:hypothetical protein
MVERGDFNLNDMRGHPKGVPTLNFWMSAYLMKRWKSTDRAFLIVILLEI